MTAPLEVALATLTSLGGDAARERHAEFSASLVTLLQADPAAIPDLARHQAALSHGFAYYYWKWDPRGTALYDPVAAAIARWSAEPQPPVSLLCELVDFVYFLVWCFEESSSGQCARLVGPLRAASEGLARTTARRDLPLPAEGRPLRVAWLGMFAQSDNPMSIALRAVAPALRARGHRLDVYAWRFIDDPMRAHLAAAGATLHEFTGGVPLDTIGAIEAQARSVPPDIVVSDMNNGVPTALFSRRLAPVQVFLQAGMPAWPVRHLDAVFNSFGFDPAQAGWGDAAMLRIDAPWDAAALNPPVPEADIAAERALLPQGTRLVGSYGRFSKVTIPYLQAVERILLRCPDVTFVLGGTGDAAHVKAFIAASPAGGRMAIQERWVAGHVWGHILEMLLDTWPVTGGVSAREMLAKSKPVITCYSAEMPAIHRQRDADLVAADWDGFVDKAVHLLQDAGAYAAASARAGALVRRLSAVQTFEDELDADLRLAIRHARQRRPGLGRMLAGVRGLLGLGRR
jgi:hypothetical protein